MANHTDVEYKDASQIAYIKFLNQANENMPPRDEPYTIKELVESYIDVDYARETRALVNPDKEVGYEDEIQELKDLISYSELNAEDKAKLEFISDNAYNWKFVTCRDTNSTTGFYGCLLETDKGDAIVGMRGSEAVTSYENIVNDWFRADAGLLKGLTPQDLEAQRFADTLVAEGYLSKYNSFDVAGHSLGGELSSHFCIYLASKYPEVFNNLGTCANMDGPGRIAEYFEEYKKEIEQLTSDGKLIHYRTSLVGGMLKPLPGSDLRYVDIKDLNLKNSFFYNLGILAAVRHTQFEWQEQDGYYAAGKQDAVSFIANMISNYIDNYDKEAKAYSFFAMIANDILQTNQYGETELSEYGKLFLIQTAMELSLKAKILSLKNPVLFHYMVKTAIVLATAAAAITLASMAIDYWQVHGEKIILSVTTTFKEILSDFKDVIEEIETSLISFWNATKETLKNAINPAYFYSTENPYIKVNTNDLRYYGDRLYNINNRVKDIDRRIHALYGQVNLLDILNLIQADILIGHSYRIDNCQNYLYDTASYFEQAEHNISSSID